MEKEKSKAIEELIKKYNIDIKALKQEQKKLAKQLKIKDSKNFSNLQSIGAIANAFTGNNIISAIIICNPDNLELIEENYFSDKLKFPYIPGFRAYRELPTMTQAFNKLEERPDIILIKGHGIAHPSLGLASHFSITTGIPTIGISEKLLAGETKGENIMLDKKIVGKVFQSKPGSKPLYISPGNFISVETAFEIVKKLIKPPHKLPEPLHLAHKYAKKIQREIKKIIISF